MEKQKIKELDKEGRTLKAEMEAEKQRRIQLDMYSWRENLRLIGIQEKELEDVEKIVVFSTRWVFYETTWSFTRYTA